VLWVIVYGAFGATIVVAALIKFSNMMGCITIETILWKLFYYLVAALVTSLTWKFRLYIGIFVRVLCNVVRFVRTKRVTFLRTFPVFRRMSCKDIAIVVMAIMCMTSTGLLVRDKLVIKSYDIGTYISLMWFPGYEIVVPTEHVNAVKQSTNWTNVTGWLQFFKWNFTNPVLENKTNASNEFVEEDSMEKEAERLWNVYLEYMNGPDSSEWKVPFMAYHVFIMKNGMFKKVCDSDGFKQRKKTCNEGNVWGYLNLMFSEYPPWQAAFPQKP